MSMKTILVPTANDDAMRSALETALLLARRYDSYIEGFALRWGINDLTGVDMMRPSGMPRALFERRLLPTQGLNCEHRAGFGPAHTNLSHLSIRYT